MIHNFLYPIEQFGTTMRRGEPPIIVAHPEFGQMGHICHSGFIPDKRHWTSVRAIQRDTSRRVVKLLRRFEDRAPAVVVAAALAALQRDPYNLPFIVGVIASYDNIISARGNGLLEDVWSAMTAALGGVASMWYNSYKQAWSGKNGVYSIAAYTNGGTGGAVINAATTGAIPLTYPGGSNQKYLIGIGAGVSSLAGFTWGILYDLLWAGNYSLTSNATINPTTDVTTTRYSGTAAAGNRMLSTLAATLTHTAAATVTTTYTDQGGTTGRTTISICPATGPLATRIVFNTLHNSATVVAVTPFMPMTNGGIIGVRNLEQVQVSGGTMTSGTNDMAIVRPLIAMPFLATNSFVEQDTSMAIMNMVELVKGSDSQLGALDWALYASNTTAATMTGMYRTVEG